MHRKCKDIVNTDYTLYVMERFFEKTAEFKGREEVEKRNNRG